MFLSGCDIRKHLDGPLSWGAMFRCVLRYSSNWDNVCTREKGLRVAFGRLLEKSEFGRW